MRIVNAFLLCISMFTRIPVPETGWTAENRKNALLFLPIVGALIGLLLILFSLIARALSFGAALTGAGYALLPLLVTGGIHLDGFADTVDALSSHQPADKKRAILKDPHVGAFGVIYTAAYLVCYFAACTELPASALSALILLFILTLSRALGGIAVSAFPNAEKTGLAASFSLAADQKTTVGVLAAIAVFCAAFLIGLSALSGLAAVCAAAACLFLVHRIAERDFSGMSGDIAGYLISISELFMLLAYVVFSKVV